MLLLKKVDRAVALALVRAMLRGTSEVLAQEPPELLAKDHVLEVGHLAQNRLAEGVVDSGQHEGMARLTIDDALEDMVALDADGHDHVFFGQCPRLSFMVVSKF